MSRACCWAPRAWLADGWHDDVLLAADDAGRWAAVSADTPCPAGATRLAGPALPGLVDAHSHAFQRAFAGLAERGAGSDDDFWSWRERMYQVALAVSPEALRAIATQLYIELLRGGYTQVCEFHYLHRAPDGADYADPLAMAWALAEAAGEAGIGLTLLPVLYERAGFGEPALRAPQRRFRADAEAVWAMQRDLAASGRPLLGTGLAIHSLRAASPDSIARLLRLAEGYEGSIHIHVAEQAREVDDCLAATGLRPIEWLARQGLLDRRWQLVHATHATRAEIDAVAASGAGIVLCPATEANLGDGLADLPGWLAAGVPMALGSDSQVTRTWREELRWLDYGQRLLLRRRGALAAPEGGASGAERLWVLALEGGARAAGAPCWGLVAGARADLLVVDTEDASLLGVPPARLFDALVYSSPGRPWRDVMVAGRWVVREHRHAASARAAERYRQAVQAIAA